LWVPYSTWKPRVHRPPAAKHRRIDCMPCVEAPWLPPVLTAWYTHAAIRTRVLARPARYSQLPVHSMWYVCVYVYRDDEGKGPHATVLHRTKQAARQEHKYISSCGLRRGGGRSGRWSASSSSVALPRIVTRRPGGWVLCVPATLAGWLLITVARKPDSSAHRYLDGYLDCATSDSVACRLDRRSE
jgi:hypothetical protein